MAIKECVLYSRACNDCGECNYCDLNPLKICDNCGKCIEPTKEFEEIKIDGVITSEVYSKNQLANHKADIHAGHNHEHDCDCGHYHN